VRLAPWLAVVLLVPATAAAQQGSPGGSVGELAERVRARVVAAVPGEGRDVALAVVPSLPEEAPRAEALADALAASVLAALRTSGDHRAVDRLSATASPEGAAREAVRRGYDAFVHIALSARRGRLLVEGAVFRASRGGWVEVFVPAPERIVDFSLRATLDAQLGSYVGTLPPVGEEDVVARRLVVPGRGYVALGALDVNGDGADELVLARPDWVDVLRVATRDGRLRGELLGSAEVPELPARPSRVRRPVGTAVRRGDAVVVRTSEHARPFEVRVSTGDATEVLVRGVDGPCAEGFPSSDACAVLVDGRDYFHSDLRPMGEGGAPPPAPAGFYTRVSRRLRQADGTLVPVEAVVTPRGRMGGRVGASRGGAVGYGAALALPDLEQDGTAELLASGADRPGETDRLHLLRARADGTLIAVWSSEEIEGWVMVAGAADLDGDGREELVAIAEPPPGVRRPARLWVVR